MKTAMIAIGVALISLLLIDVVNNGHPWMSATRRNVQTPQVPQVPQVKSTRSIDTLIHFPANRVQNDRFAVNRNSTMREHESRREYDDRLKYTSAYLDWLDSAGVSADQDIAIRAALADKTSNFWIVMRTYGIGTDQVLASTREDDELFDRRLREILSPEQFESFDREFPNGDLLVAVRMVETPDLQEFEDQPGDNPALTPGSYFVFDD